MPRSGRSVLLPISYLMSPSRRARAAFSLIELVIVVVITGIIAGIAIPRMSSAASNADIASLRASLVILNTAVDHYTAEHHGLAPNQAPDGSADPSTDNLLKRLMTPTAIDGSFTGSTIYGPYLRSFPKNILSGSRTLRLDGAAAGVNTAGWRFDSVQRVFQPDDSARSAALAVQADDAAAIAVEGN
jgi:prepilin-type N-terminal cleavage/methylation domain-containing protein